MTFDFIEEFKLDAVTQEQIREQLNTHFKAAEFDTRIYLKQRAHYRFLLKDQGVLIGQMGLDFRSMLLGETPIQVLGVIDFTIATDKQGQGFGTKMLQELDNIALQYKENIDFLFLAADIHNVYRNNGFKNVKQKVKWLGFHEDKTIGILERDTDYLMIKPVGDKAWNEDALLDMMGYMY